MGEQYPIVNRLQYITICLILLCVFSCKKKNNEPATSATTTSADIDFTYMGTLWAYRPITFTTDLQDTTKIFWDFGDGIAGKYNNAKHQYLKDTTYTVTLYYDGKTVSKKIKIGMGLDTILLGFTNWHVKYSFWQYNNPDSPFIPNIYFPETDITFSLRYISYESDSLPYAIIIPGDKSISNCFNDFTMGLYSMNDESLFFTGSEGSTSSIYRKGDSALIEIYQPCIYNNKSGQYYFRYTSKR